MKETVEYVYSWSELNDVLRDPKMTERDVEMLLERQRRLGANRRWLNRIWGRLKVLRNRRERRELITPYKGPRVPKQSREETEMGA